MTGFDDVGVSSASASVFHDADVELAHADRKEYSVNQDIDLVVEYSKHNCVTWRLDHTYRTMK